MGREFPEKDWKKVRTLKDAALNVACERIFQKVERLMESRGAESYKYYLKLFDLIREQDKEISLMFDDLNRGTAIFKLSVWKRNGILSDENFREFSEETQARIESFCEIRR